MQIYEEIKLAQQSKQGMNQFQISAKEHTILIAILVVTIFIIYKTLDTFALTQTMKTYYHIAPFLAGENIDRFNAKLRSNPPKLIISISSYG